MGKGKKKVDMSELSPGEAITDYAAADADHTLRLYHLLNKELDRHEVRHVYEDIELPLIPILAEAEGRGVLVDEEHIEQVKARTQRV